MIEERRFTITIDGRDYRIPDDLDLNDSAALEEEGLSLDDKPQTAIRYLVWRILRRDNPEITLEEAGSKVTFAMLNEEADKEGPPPIPLSEPDLLSGTSSGGSKGNGSTGEDVKVEMRAATGLR